jgi:hypothetical protein
MKWIHGTMLATPFLALVVIAAVPEVAPADEIPGDPVCSTFYNDYVQYAADDYPTQYHSSYNGDIMYDPDHISWVFTAGEAEVTGSSHNDWQLGHVPKVNHSACGGSGGGHHH